MPTSPLTDAFKLTNAKISRGTLGYVCTRARQWAYNLLVIEFKKSGLSQVELGRRLDKAPEIISRMLNRPGNLELDTFSAAIFAITGGLLSFSVRHPKQSSLQIFPAKQLQTTDTQTNPANVVEWKAAA